MKGLVNAYEEDCVAYHLADQTFIAVPVIAGALFLRGQGKLLCISNKK